MTTKGAALLTREGKLILTSVLLNSVPLGYMNVVPLVYLLQIGYNPATIGAIYAASGVANTVGYTPFGILADRYGRRKFLVIGSLLPALSYGIFGLTLDPYLLTVASVVGGVGLAGGLATAISSPSLLPLLAASAPDKQRTSLFALLEGTGILALSIGSYLSFLPGVIASSLSQGAVLAHSESYFVMAAITVGSVVPLLFVAERRRGSTTSAGAGAAGLLSSDGPIPSVHEAPRRIQVTSWLRIAKFSLIFSLTGLGFGTLVQLLPTWYSLRFGVSEGTVGLWVAIALGISLIAIPVIPALVRSRGTVNASAAAGIAACAPLILMPLSGSFETVASLFVLRSVLTAINVPVLQSYLVGVVSEKERATTVGIAFTAWGVANSVGTLIGGDLLGADLLVLPFVIGTAGYLGSSLAFLLFFRRARPPEEVVSFSRVT